jgi:hypothetical protein
VILIFFLIIIFAGIKYLAHYFTARQKALLIARSCAWQYSFLACDPDKKSQLPPMCAGVLREEDLANEPLADAANPQNTEGAIYSPTGSTDSEARQSEEAMRGGLNSRLQGMLALVVGEAVDARASQPIPRGPMLAAAEDQGHASYYLPCNLQNQSALEVVTDLWSDMDMRIPR